MNPTLVFAGMAWSEPEVVPSVAPADLGVEVVACKQQQERVAEPSMANGKR